MTLKLTEMYICLKKIKGCETQGITNKQTWPTVWQFLGSNYHVSHGAHSSQPLVFRLLDFGKHICFQNLCWQLPVYRNPPPLFRSHSINNWWHFYTSTISSVRYFLAWIFELMIMQESVRYWCFIFHYDKIFRAVLLNYRSYVLHHENICFSVC
jgi:hypothetical protein